MTPRSKHLNQRAHALIATTSQNCGFSEIRVPHRDCPLGLCFLCTPSHPGTPEGGETWVPPAPPLLRGGSALRNRPAKHGVLPGSVAGSKCTGKNYTGQFWRQFLGPISGACFCPSFYGHPMSHPPSSHSCRKLSRFTGERVITGSSSHTSATTFVGIPMGSMITMKV